MQKADGRDPTHDSQGYETPDLANVERGVEQEFERMQRPEQREALSELFEADGEALGRAALDAATAGPVQPDEGSGERG